jgi:hypothetical protein
LSDPNISSVIGIQQNWILPEEVIEQILLKPMYPSGTQAQISDTVSFCPLDLQKLFDVKAKAEIVILNVPKNIKAIDETEGILCHLTAKMKEQNMEPADLVKKVWKNSEQNDT